jgi:hypothetical protein
MLWPNFCIDNFFQNPDSVLDFAKTLKFYKTNGTYPGERTKPLHEIDHDFFLNVTKKIVACLYPNDVKNLIWCANQYFQKIKPQKYSTKGFIHQDMGTEFTSIIYLSDNESNTCIYKRLKENIPNHLKVKEEAYLNKIKQNSPRFQKALKENNKSYEKTIEFKSIKNRMILFDGSSDHGVESFGKRNEKERLTLITFFSSISRTDGKDLKFHSSECKRY